MVPFPKLKGLAREPVSPSAVPSPQTVFIHPSPTPSYASATGLGPTLTQTHSQTHSLSHSRAGSFSDSGTMPQRGMRKPPPALERDRSDALWAEMQATLEEVELSASGGTHIFGADHDRKLAELRAEQIALAQAWARSEADDAIDTKKDKDVKAPLSALGESTRDGDGSKSVGSGAQRPSTSGGPNDRLGSKLQEETEIDMLLARKRREANDVYFDRVNRGVLDVVAKLGDVAAAMSAVEQESRGIWNEVESTQERT